MNYKSLFRTKPFETSLYHHLKPCLTATDLATLGIGAIIGAGIFILTGIAAATKAGPAICVSYFIAAIACGLAALAYAELSSSIGGCGSAYNYAITGIGELAAWIIGWDLLLEYGLSCPAVAIGWSGYVANTLQAFGIPLPRAFLSSPFDGGFINLPAVFIVGFISFILAIGVKESIIFNKIMVYIKLTVIFIFIILASFYFNPKANWHPFMPFGWGGVVSGAALIFFAFIGFDAVVTAAEEAIHPQRDLPIGIIVSLVVCTILYVVVSALLTGAVPYTELNVSSPVAHALLLMGYRFGGGITALGAIAGLTTVIIVMYYGFTRVFLAMARDKLLPVSLATVDPNTKTPKRIIMITGILMMIIAGIMPIQRVAELVNIGTLAAFTIVCISVIVLRYTKPDLHRPFRAPWSPYLPLLGCVFCIYLMLHLPLFTWGGFLIWSSIGLVIYFRYSRFWSVLNHHESK